LVDILFIKYSRRSQPEEKAPRAKSDEHRFSFLPNCGFVPKDNNFTIHEKSRRLDDLHRSVIHQFGPQPERGEKQGL
jgi:hypothetical protein